MAQEARRVRIGALTVTIAGRGAMRANTCEDWEVLMNRMFLLEGMIYKPSVGAGRLRIDEPAEQWESDRRRWARRRAQGRGGLENERRV